MAQPEPQARPPLSVRSSAWRYLFAAAVGCVAWIVHAAALRIGSPIPVRQDRVDALFLDLVLGAVAVALLTLRRRYPLAVACVMVAISAVSAAALGAMVLAIVSMATWRRWGWVIAVGAVATAGAVLSEGVAICCLASK